GLSQEHVVLARRLGSESDLAKLLDRPQRRQLESFAGAWQGMALEAEIRRFQRLASARVVAMKHKRVAMIQAIVRKLIDVLRDFRERIKEHPFDERMQHAILFENRQTVVIGAVFADQAFPFFRQRRRLFLWNAYVGLLVPA